MTELRRQTPFQGGTQRSTPRNIREGASEAGDFLRATIEQRPYTAAAVALAIGYLIGRFGRHVGY